MSDNIIENPLLDEYLQEVAIAEARKAEQEAFLEDLEKILEEYGENSPQVVS